MTTELQITLAPEVAAIVVKEAARLGTSADAIANDAIRQRYASTVNEEAPAASQSLAEVLGSYIGAISSGGANLSQDSGELFAEGMAEKRRQGKL